VALESFATAPVGHFQKSLWTYSRLPEDYSDAVREKNCERR